MRVLVKISRIGACSIYCYVAFIIYVFIKHWADGKVDLSQVKSFSSDPKDIASSIGNFALAFMVHNAVT